MAPLIADKCAAWAAAADKLQATVAKLDAWKRDVIYPLANEHIHSTLTAA